MERELVVTFDEGAATFVYDDRLAFLTDHGDVEIVRASHVEPLESGQWVADMRPTLDRMRAIGIDVSAISDVLGPFRLRRDALCAERDWLATYRGL